ncbi:MAG: ABC transporter permease [Alphaproteobacteria bacterium]|nr:ABC transporter permease [Alphaproteobacteria bacterium]
MEAVFALIEPRIVSHGNVLNVLQQASYLVVFTVAQTLVILTRGFDLSLGTTVSAVSVASALVLTAYGDAPAGWVIALGIAAGLGLGLAVGVFNGLLVAAVGVNPFIATLASLNICLGLATTMSGGKPVFGVPDALSTLFYDGTILGAPVTLVIAALVLIVAWIGLNRTVFGRAVYIIGSNPRAAMVAGLPARGVLVGAYVICSLLAALGALMQTARTGSGEPNLGGSLMLQSIAAAVIGGTSLRGGSGGVGSALLGALFVTMLSNGMNLLRISGYVQMIALGVVVILATALDFRQRQRAG